MSKSLKFKRTLEEANTFLPTITEQQFSQDDKMKYCLNTGLGMSTLWRYMNGKCPSIVAANHLADHIDDLLKSVAA